MAVEVYVCRLLVETRFVSLKGWGVKGQLGELTCVENEDVVDNALLAIAFSAAEDDKILTKLS